MRLNTDWFLEPVIDFETKKYQLLAYLQCKQEELLTQKLCPTHAELKEKYLALEEVIKNKTQLENSIYREIEKIDWKNLQLIYKNENQFHEKLNEMMDIIFYAFPKINSCRNNFKEEIEKIKTEIHLDVVGLLPNYLQDGYLILEQPSGYYLFTYEKQALLNLDGEKRFLHEHLKTYQNTLIHSPNSIKKEIHHANKNKVEMPAVFVVSYKEEIPIYETLLPLSGWALQKFVA